MVTTASFSNILYSLCLFLLCSCSTDLSKNEDALHNETEDSCTDLIWSEEFDGNSIDETKWSYQRGGWNASKVQNCYVDENTTVSEGTLKITAKYEPGVTCFEETKDFTSGFIQTKNKVAWTFGYFEAKVKVPASNSTWPAFWLSPQENIYGAWPRSGEIDVFEIKGHNLKKSYANAHWGESNSEKVQEKGAYSFTNNAAEWHIYAVDWTLGKLDFYIDNMLYHSIEEFKQPNAAEPPGPFNKDFYLRLNMAVGGTYLEEPHSNAHTNIDQLPAVMEVDYVRVYSKKPECL